jgi:pyrroloquinoline-quinone synthase
MDQNDFWTAAAEQLRVYDLLSHPFYLAWTAGELTPEELGFYGRQYLNHVAAFPTYLTALHCRLPDGAMRRTVLRNAWEEEGTAMAHSDLFTRFASEMDTLSSPAGSQPLPEVRRLVETYHEIARYASPPMVLGAFYAYESQVPSVAEAKLATLKTLYGASDRACAYFELHLSADVEHAKVWRALIDSSIDENPRCAQEALDGVKRGARALWSALDGIEAAR